MIFQMTGSFLQQQLEANQPLIDFVVNRTTSLFMWQFKVGNKKQNHFYEMWSTTNKVNITNKLVNLTDLPRDPLPTNFNLTITCGFPIFTVKLNFWEPGSDPNGIPRNPTSWDASIEVDTRLDPDDTQNLEINGAMEVLKSC